MKIQQVIAFESVAGIRHLNPYHWVFSSLIIQVVSVQIPIKADVLHCTIGSMESWWKVVGFAVHAVSARTHTACLLFIFNIFFISSDQYNYFIFPFLFLSSNPPMYTPLLYFKFIVSFLMIVTGTHTHRYMCGCIYIILYFPKYIKLDWSVKCYLYVYVCFKGWTLILDN